MNTYELEVPSTYEEWAKKTNALLLSVDLMPFYIGDMLNHGFDAYGEKASQVIPEGKSKATIQNWMYVCRRVPQSRRLYDVPFSFYQDVAGHEPGIQMKVLQNAEKENWSRKQLRDFMREKKYLPPSKQTHSFTLEQLQDLWNEYKGSNEKDFVFWLRGRYEQP